MAEAGEISGAPVVELMQEATEGQEEQQPPPQEDSGKELDASESKTHPLENAWTLWFDKPDPKSRGSAWGSTMRRVYTFSTVEDFWRLYNNVMQPSLLSAGANFHLFKSGIEPKWEDPQCASGGKWTASIPRGSKTILDTFWLHTLLAMIGEQFEEGDEICGAVVSVRARQDKIALWTRTASNEAAQIGIGKQWKDVLEYQEQMGYMFHNLLTDIRQYLEHGLFETHSSDASVRVRL
ncbi:hypothetical protein O6H91_11G035500 [Diphasiastrum complanatum]|nr:hypothetical protein O6H91_11G035500 [Diphasiastrum complanatum]